MSKLRMAGGLMLLTLLLESRPAAAQAVACGQPNDLAREIYELVTTGSSLDACNWRGQLDAWQGPPLNRWHFQCWETNCSQNLPVLANVVAMMADPLYGGHDRRQWFLIYLKAQLGLPVSEQGFDQSSRITYFKSNEMFSRMYDGWTTLAVMAAYYWAGFMEPSAPYAPEIAAIADDYLRATFYLWGMSVGRSDVAAQYLNGSSTSLGGSTTEDYPVNLAGPRVGSGPTLATSQTWLFSRVTGLFGASTASVPNVVMKDLYNYMLGRWSSVRALNATQRSALISLVNDDTLPSDFSTVVGSIKMYRRMHFVHWVGGDRLTFFEGTTPNRNGGTVFAQAYYFNPYNGPGREVHFLYPYNGSPHNEAADGQLTVDAAAGRLTATSPAYPTGKSITVPTGRPLSRHVLLGPGGLRFCSGALTCP